MGKDAFQGGLNPDWSPKFESATPSIQGGALCKVVFRGVPPYPEKGHGTFFLDEIVLTVRPDPKAPFKAVVPTALSPFRKADTTPPTVSLARPFPDATVSGPVEIGATFADAGSGVDVSSVRILLDGKDVTSQAKVKPGGIGLRPSAPLEKGVHRVVVAVSDNAGNAGNRLAWRFGVGVPVRVRAAFERGVFLVNGEPHFPIGLYNGSCDPKNPLSASKPYLAQAAAAGVNCQMLGESTGPAHLDVMLARGMKALKAVTATLAAMGETGDGPMVQMADATKDHPAMLGWWASDPDTMEKTRANVAAAYRVLRRRDPDHPVIWILSHADKYKQTLPTTDACFTYHYPITQGVMGPAALYTRALKPAFEAANPVGKQVWFASQGIDLRLAEGEKLAPGAFRPTAAEIRVMNYLALAKGVKGLFFYAGGGSPTPGVYNDLTEYPAQWREAMKIATEVRYLSPVLAAGRPVETARPDPPHPAIHSLELEQEGVHTMLAVNVGAIPVSAAWRLDKPVRPMVLFENRTLSEPTAKLTDHFEPLEVHIYRWK